MKFTCRGNVLFSGLGIVEKAVSVRTSLPVLENVYLSLSGNTLTLRGNDLELGIETQIEVDGLQDGAVLLKAKTLSSIVSKLQTQQLIVAMDDRFNVTIQADNRVDFHIMGLSADEYPIFPIIEHGTSVQLKVEEMQHLIKYTIFAVSFDETKQFLNGILVKSEGDQLSFVATDGYRLSIKNHRLGALPEPAFSVIVPFKVMNEFSRIISQAKPDTVFELNVSKHQVSFVLGKTICMSRVIQGQFPDYKQVLPQRAGNAFSISRRAFLEACERASIIAFASNNVIRLLFRDNVLEIHANAQGMGEFREELQISRIAGEGDAKIAFNVRLILDSIKNLDMDDLRVEFDNELSPCLVKPVSDQDYKYIIMPIRTSDFQHASQTNEAVGQHV